MKKQRVFDNFYPLGMVKGNKNRVWLKNGSELRVKVNPTNNSRYVTINKSFNKIQHVNVDKLYNKLFKAKSVKSEFNSNYSKSELMYHNRSGYQAPLKGRDNIISTSGYFLMGKNIGKHVSDISTKSLQWYLDNFELKNNELIVVKEELKCR